MPSQHKTPLLGWHPPARLGEWVRAEAKRRGVPISAVLNEAVESYRTGHIPVEEEEDRPYLSAGEIRDLEARYGGEERQP
jgi:hypothetical protein